MSTDVVIVFLHWLCCVSTIEVYYYLLYFKISAIPHKAQMLCSATSTKSGLISWIIVKQTNEETSLIDLK